MTFTVNSSQAFQDQLAEIQEIMETEKIELSPEVEAYLKQNLELVTDKISQGEKLTKEDLDFLQSIQLWIFLPDEMRDQYPSIEQMKEAEEMEGVTISEAKEARKRGLSPIQWLDLVYMADAADKKKEWIDETFSFPGRGRIQAQRLVLPSTAGLIRLPDNMTIKKNVNIESCRSLQTLPRNFKVGGTLNLTGCDSVSTIPSDLECRSLYFFAAKSLTMLPDNFKVYGTLYLESCNLITSLPNNVYVGDKLNLDGCEALRELPDDLEVKNTLQLADCFSLTKLPKNLSLSKNLDIRSCRSLSSLPARLYVGGDLHLTNNLNEQVKEDARRLKKKGRIRGDIIYDS